MPPGSTNTNDAVRQEYKKNSWYPGYLSHDNNNGWAD